MEYRAFVLLIFVFLLQKADSTCPAGAVQSIIDTSTCYSFYSVQLSFTDAEQTCTDLSGHLASIKNGFVNVFITEQTQKIFRRINATNFWIGASDLAAPGIWSWTDGTPFSFADWASGEPNLNSGSDCAQVQMADGSWRAINCFTKLPFVCTTPAVSGVTCPATCDEGWAVFNKSCYKLGFNANFDDAEASCVNDGGHLASIHSTQESIFVSGLSKADTVCPTGSFVSLSDPTICYSLLTSPTEYLNAEQTCVDLGGHLASVDSAFTNTFLVQKAQSIFTNGNSSDFWIGGNDLASSGVWTWTDGKPFSFADWAPGEPVATSGADCLGVALNGGLWSAQNCFIKKPYICALPGTVIESCPLSCPSEWTIFNNTGSCYKVYFDKKWNDAEAFCVSEGAHLTSIHSEEENIFVNNLAQTTLKLSTPDMTMIGLYTEDKNKNWKWTDGSPVDFIKWAHNQPDNAGKENCVMTFSDVSEWLAEQSWYQEFNNFNCGDTYRAFVCKKAAIQA